ncbi:ROK family protein [Pseudalkalibacillus salsuginis]|uniref:ROK family protein n=1 Tax=Pseudalkalibacillus salsuginis TaxID=2910972 RepID=UPI001F3D5F3E|nr:ROK family protein [Pseudalkalibacillus salsuginis]MCF6411569.1 ROK family protein [Pseudalkalibacillus salsuginis]
MKAIGIDIGGTTIKGAIVDEKRKIHHQVTIQTNRSEGRNGILATLTTTIDQLLENETEIMGIGIGTAGRVDVDRGKVIYSTANLPGWQGINLREFITNTYALPAFIDNDANAALAGEWWNRGEIYDSVTFLTLGTGVGGANMIRRKIFRGNLWNGGEWGHVILYPEGRACNCGNRGCIEQYLSGTALVKTANGQSGRTYTNGADLFEAFQAGDRKIQPIVERYLDDLALVVYNLSVSIDPEAVIIGGGVIESKDQWWDVLIEKLTGKDVNLDVLPAALGNKAGMIGAVKLLFDAMSKGGEV